MSSASSPGTPAPDRPPPAGPSGAVRRHNYSVIQADSIPMGVVNASTPFLPVLLARLGASSALVGLLAALPAITGVLIALPTGRWLQGQPNIVPWYSRFRLIANLGYAAIGAAVVVASPEWATGAVIIIWALATLPLTAALVSFPIVMDGAAGPAGRYELLGRRWAIMGFTTAITVALAGQLLSLASFPLNYGLLFGAFSVAGVVSFWFTRQIRIADQPQLSRRDDMSPRQRIGDLVALVREERPLIGHEARAFVVNASIGLTAPLVPLFYVRELGAPDAWIGAIVAGQAAGTLVGYLAGRRVSRLRGGHWVLLPALLGTALFPLVLALLSNVIAVAVLAVISGFFIAGLNLGLFDELMRRVPERHGVTFTSLDYTVQNVALMLAPIAGGILAVAIGLRQALVVASAVGLVGFGFFVLEERTARRRRPVRVADG